MEPQTTEEAESANQTRSLDPDPNQLCTSVLYRLIEDYQECIRFFFFTIHLATSADEVRTIASKALATTEDAPEYVEHRERIKSNPSPVFDELKKFGRIQSQYLVLRCSNSFLLFYSEIIQGAIVRRPELLKSKQTIRWDELLGFSRFHDIVHYLIDKKVNELSYAGLGQMEEFMFDRLGIAGVITQEQRNLTAILVEIRNIYTHNRGIVNGIFLSRLKDHMGFDFAEGKYFQVDYDEFVRLIGNSLEVTYAIDEAIARKFGLKRKRYAVWKGSNARAAPKAVRPA